MTAADALARPAASVSVDPGTPPSTAGGLPAPVAQGGIVAAPAPALAAPTLRRRRRVSPAWLSFLLMVATPTVVAGLYYLLLASGQYVAEFRFGLRSSEPLRTTGGMLLSGGAAPAQTVLDSYAVAQYLRSRAILDDLGKSLDLRAMFSTAAADWPARLHLPVTIEELTAYWRRQVDAFFDPVNGTIVVRARAFSAGDALRLARGVLAACERLVNAMSARARRDALRQSENDVKTAERRLAAALAQLRDYRDKEGLIDPGKAADANAALAGRLRDEVLRADAELATMQVYLSAEAPALKLLEARIATLKAQEDTLAGEATDTAATRRRALSRVLGGYEELDSERRFAETAYRHALEALDRARLEADRQQIYLVDFVPPRLPEEPLYPRRLRKVAIVFAAAFAVWAIGGLGLRSVRDHL